MSRFGHFGCHFALLIYLSWVKGHEHFPASAKGSMKSPTKSFIRAGRQASLYFYECRN